MKIHSGEKHECQVCGKPFAKRDYMQAHIKKRHTNLSLPSSEKYNEAANKVYKEENETERRFEKSTKVPKTSSESKAVHLKNGFMMYAYVVQ